MQDLNDLQYFAQVMRHGGASAASRATGEPKSKLSKRVVQLEQGLRCSPHRALGPHHPVIEIGRDVYAQCEVNHRGTRGRHSSPASAMKFTGACA